MPPVAVSRTTNARRSRQRRLPAALTALAVAAAVSLWGGPARPLQAQVADEQPVFFTQTPPILRPDYTGTVQLEIVYTGAVPDLRVFYFRLGAGYLFRPVSAGPDEHDRHAYGHDLPRRRGRWATSCAASA